MVPQANKKRALNAKNRHEAKTRRIWDTEYIKYNRVNRSRSILWPSLSAHPALTGVTDFEMCELFLFFLVTFLQTCRIYLVLQCMIPLRVLWYFARKAHSCGLFRLNFHGNCVMKLELHHYANQTIRGYWMLDALERQWSITIAGLY